MNMSYLGIDLGTSGIKVIVCDEQGRVIASETSPLEVTSVQPLWSEQSPESWWQALDACMTGLKLAGFTQDIEAIAIAGQMHGAVLLDDQNAILRPAILWNDGRSAKECKDIMEATPEAKNITGNLVMPGFTAPKLKWLEKNEPDIFQRTAKVLLPKDYLRFRLTGSFVSDMSDAAGTSWLDTEKRCWSTTMLRATNMTEAQMPQLCEGPAVTGHLHKSIADQWGLANVPVMGGAGDNAAGAIGSGIIQSGQAMLSLGTSGVIFAVTDKYVANPDGALHSFCHALPNTWHVMSVHLSAASCLQWFANIAANGDVGSLIEEVQSSTFDIANAPYFLPYLSGERTPHNNPNLGGEFSGLTMSTSRAEMTYAILEGVAFSLKDGLGVIEEAGINLDKIAIIGGGAKSDYWRQLITNVLGVNCNYHQGGDVGPALGAARLAMLGANPSVPIEQICPVPPILSEHQPDPKAQVLNDIRYRQFTALAQAANDRTTQLNNAV